jgi:hypothetical protein
VPSSFVVVHAANTSASIATSRNVINFFILVPPLFL